MTTPASLSDKLIASQLTACDLGELLTALNDACHHLAVSPEVSWLTRDEFYLRMDVLRGEVKRALARKLFEVQA